MARARRSHGGGRISHSNRPPRARRGAPGPGREPPRRPLTAGQQAERPGPCSSRGLGERDTDTALSPRRRGPGSPRPRRPAPPASAEPPGSPGLRPPPASPSRLRPPGTPPPPSLRHPDTARPRRTGARGRCDTAPQRPARAAPPRRLSLAAAARASPGEAKPLSRPPIRAPCPLRPAHRRPAAPARGSVLFPPPPPHLSCTWSRYWATTLPLRPG